MDGSILEQFMNLIELYGLPTAIITTIIVSFFMIFKSKLILDSFKKFFKKDDKKSESVSKSPKVVKVSESDVINHEIFSHIDFWLYSEIPTMEFATKFRTEVFRKYLYIYFKAYKNKLHIYVNSGKFKSMDDSELRQSLMDLIHDTIFEYESEMSSSGIPDIIISKMKVKNNDTLNLTKDLINSICDSYFYNSEHNLLKIFSLLNIVLSILENTVTNSIGVCSVLNGELKGLSMNGFTEGDD